LFCADADSESEGDDMLPEGQSQGNAGISVIKDKAFVERQAQRAKIGTVAVFGGNVLFLAASRQPAEEQTGNEVIDEAGYLVGKHGASFYGGVNGNG